MTDFDLDRLGDVWRQQPDPAELEMLRRSAAAVSRRARWTMLLDIGVAILVAAIVLLLVFTSPNRSTVLVGSAAILFLLYSNIRSRRIRQLELRALAGTTENMIDQSIERLQATLKYNLISLIGFGPGMAIGVLLAASSGISPDTGMLSVIHSSPLLRFLLGKGVFVFIAGAVIYLLITMRRGRRELNRLLVMREAYREERKSSD